MDDTEVIKTNSAPTLLVAVVAFAVGGAIGYFFGKKNGTVIEIPADLTNDLKPDPNQLVLCYTEDQMTEMLGEEVGTFVQQPHSHVQEEPVVTNVFEHEDVWDYEAEHESRYADTPYIIHVEEYKADDMGFKQATVTYYAGDDIMVDVNDVPIYNHAGIMGELKFGHGSGDPMVVYIRNESIHKEWEVLHHSGSFSLEHRQEEIEAAEDKHLQHSVHRFRED